MANSASDDFEAYTDPLADQGFWNSVKDTFEVVQDANKYIRSSAPFSGGIQYAFARQEQYAWQSKQEAELQITFASGSNCLGPAVWVGTSASGTGYAFFHDSGQREASADNSIVCLRVAGGTGIVLAEALNTWANNDVFKIQVERSGADALLRCFINDALVTDFGTGGVITDPFGALAEGAVGLFGIHIGGNPRGDNWAAADYDPPIVEEVPVLRQANQMPL